MSGQNGKGDSYRPVNRALYEANYERIFRKGRKRAAVKRRNKKVGG